MLGAGVLSVSMYRKRLPGVLITPGMGMRIGALAGVFGFMINAIVTVLSFVVFRSSADFRRAMQEQMEKQMANNPDPKGGGHRATFCGLDVQPARRRNLRGADVDRSRRGVHRDHRRRWRTGSFYGGQSTGIAMITNPREQEHNVRGKSCSSASAFRMMPTA